MFVTLSALCAGAFAVVCTAAVTPVTTPTPRPADFILIERDLDLTSKMQEMFTGYAQLCQRNLPEACLTVQALTTLRSNLYFASQRCGQAEPQDCDLYVIYRGGILATHDQFKADAVNIERVLRSPTAADLRLQEQLAAQRLRDEAFMRRMEALERARTQTLGTIGQ